MKIIAIHSDSIKFKPIKKAIKSAEDVKMEETEVKECLVCLTAVEKKDENLVKESAKRLAEETSKIAEQVKTKNIVLYPYAHLSSDLSHPEKAIEIMIEAEKLLKKNYKVVRAPFGWYKSFSLECKGHPLSELSRAFNAEKLDKTKIKEVSPEIKGIELKDQKFDDKDKLNYSHSLLLAAAVKELFPEAVFGFCELENEKFYCNFGNVKIHKGDLSRIQKKMEEIKSKVKINKKSVSKEDAKRLFKNSKYFLDALKYFKKENVEVYDLNGLYFLSPYAKSDYSKIFGSFEVVDLGGAYWRNDSTQDMLDRVYGVAFSSQKELKDYKDRILAAEKRDHRKIGQQQELLMFHEWSPGSAFLLPKGAIIYNELANFIREQYKKRGYQEVITPQLFNKKLWETSGHWEHFKDDMFLLEVDKEEFSLKPMNCQSHLLIFKNRLRSYKELPLRLADFCYLYRNELKGVLSGMTRVRKLSQDDAHIFCTEEQLKEEIEKLIDFVKYVYRDIFKMEFVMNLSTMPKEAMGDKKLWDKAEKLLEDTLKKSKMNYQIKKGEGAFYGPKIDIDVKDALGRMWQLATIQLDFQMPLRFNAEYEGKDNKKHPVIMIHRAILGSLERFMGVMIEHFAGKFPLWLSPVQIKVLTVTERNEKFALEILNKLKDRGIRAELDDRSETIPKKVRDAELENVPITLTIGDKESDNKTLAVRDRSGKVKFGVKSDEFIQSVLNKIETRSMDQ